MINFPVQENEQFNLGIVQGEKRVIYPILYYILSKWDELQTRAYLARYLIPPHIPEDILADLEVSEIHLQYKDLQAEFQLTHQQLENAHKDMMRPQDLRKEIQRYINIYIYFLYFIIFFISYHIISYPIISYQIISYHIYVISHQIISYISYPIISYHIIYI